jgi:glutathione synthase/RimK-type ligase-like ATP-grasp enzyme
MIVFFGRTDDAPLTCAIAEAAARGLPHLVLDQQRLDYDELIIDFEPDRVGGRLAHCGVEVDLAAISAVYARPLALGRPPSSAAARVRAERLNEAFVEWLDYASCLVVNRPHTMHSNGSKPYQLQLIAAAGFAVPATLVTNRPEDVREFRRRHERVVYKSISGIRSIVSELDRASNERIESVRELPTQFQEYVEGVDVRVHVIGEVVFATEIGSKAIDYRYAHRDGTEVTLNPVDLPREAADACLALAEEMELPFCGIDLRRRPDGGYVCFEVNPMPAYSYFEAEARQPISRALVDLLAEAFDKVTVPWSRSART